jgi:hypothetical protein
MKPFLSIIALLLNCISLPAQESILKLQPGRQYQLYFIDVVLRDVEDENLDSLRNAVVHWNNNNSFLINDEPTLNSLQANWIGKRTNEFYFCWYNYFIYVVEDGKIIDEMRVNEECKQAVCKRGVFNYETTIADKLSRDKSVSVARITFDSITAGRQFHRDIQKNQDIFVPLGEYDEWIKYDGQMGIHTNRGNVKKIQSAIDKDIKKQFSNEEFGIQHSGSGRDELHFNIYCSKNIGNNLKGYKIWSEWRELKPTEIRLFSASRVSIEDELKKYAP